MTTTPSVLFVCVKNGGKSQMAVALMRHAAGTTITIGRDAHVEPIDGTRVENWDTDDPSERGIDGIERMRLVRDDITHRIEILRIQLLSGDDVVLPHARQQEKEHQ